MDRPPYSAGHWIPDQIVRAGGRPLLARPGGRSTAITWEQVAASEAEVLVVAPCGFDEAGASAQLAQVLARPELADLPAVASGRVHAIDADSLIVRPGPRLVDGVEALAECFHPQQPGEVAGVGDGVGVADGSSVGPELEGPPPSTSRLEA
jgi:iron complex transport system substrate-binding protein